MSCNEVVDNNKKRKLYVDDKNIDIKKNKCINCSDNAHHDKFIKVDNNILYFYSSIDKTSVFLLQSKITEMIKDIKQKISLATEINCVVTWPPIIINIYSPGGGVFSAFSFIDFLTIQKINNPNLRFHTVVTGSTASAATLISICGDKRYITKNGYMLVHQLYSGYSGKYDELEDDMNNNTELMKRIKQMYKNHTKIPQDQIDEILKRDLYWNAEKCLNMGLVDYIL
jgi:ATP-dependent protease ClpP protease subunit